MMTKPGLSLDLQILAVLAPHTDRDILIRCHQVYKKFIKQHTARLVDRDWRLAGFRFLQPLESSTLFKTVLVYAQNGLRSERNV